MNTATLKPPYANPVILNGNTVKNIYSVNVETAHTHKEVFGALLDKLSGHYGVDMHRLVTL